MIGTKNDFFGRHLRIRSMLRTVLTRVAVNVMQKNALSSLPARKLDLPFLLQFSQLVGLKFVSVGNI